jgi:oligoendopeptidase F
VEKLYPFEEARDLVIAAMTPLGEEYAKPLRRAFDDRWIDVYPNKGKQGGAYSLGAYGMHPYVKMNYLGRYSDVSTLAHELGHAMHSHFSCAAQPNTTASYVIFIAEIASTFNENLLLHRMLQSGTDDRMKLGLLESYLERMRGTIYVQTMLAEFELAIHEQVEQSNTLTAKWLNDTYLALYREYFGADRGVALVDDPTAIAWAAVPHFYRPYYVFQYVTGMVASTALAESVIGGGKAEAERYLDVLRAGGSKFPLEILRDAGLDMSSPQPVEAALQQFDRLVGEMEAIYARLPAES